MMRLALSWDTYDTTADTCALLPAQDTSPPRAAHISCSTVLSSTISSSAFLTRDSRSTFPSPRALRRISRAAMATSHTSLSTSSSMTLSSEGSSISLKGATSAGFCTSLHMMSMTLEALRRIREDLFFRDLPSRGASRAITEASTVATKVVSSSKFSVLMASSGLPMTDTSWGVSGRMSSFEMDRQQVVSASRAAVCTFFFESYTHSDTRGISTGSRGDSWGDMRGAMDLSRLRAVTLIFQLSFWHSCINSGNTIRNARGFIILNSSCVATAATSRTTASLSTVSSIMRDTRGSAKGSNPFSRVLSIAWKSSTPCSLVSSVAFTELVMRLRMALPAAEETPKIFVILARMSKLAPLVKFWVLFMWSWMAVTRWSVSSLVNQVSASVNCVSFFTSSRFTTPSVRAFDLNTDKPADFLTGGASIGEDADFPIGLLFEAMVNFSVRSKT
mmetsp:Transcript_34029/g.74983  ORF Transcript_34029/g.74983 Transcript_34029/m.74983 type:complete len:446 (-) Transcript_34029:48-1385(-)